MMKPIIFIFCFILSQTLAAAPSCASLFNSESTQNENFSKTDRLAALNHQMALYFKSEWSKQRRLTDADAAKTLLEKFETHATETDLSILEVYVQILKATKGTYYVREEGFYIDLHTDKRPKSSAFQERHWDWNILVGYFFNSPSLFTFTKEQDLRYLKHVLATARQYSSPRSLKQVLQQANRSWATNALSVDPELEADFFNFAQNKNYQTLFKEFEKSVYHAKLDKDEVGSMLAAFRSSNSAFDLFLAKKYIDVFVRYPESGGKPPQWLQLTDWRVFEMGLPTGSIDHLTDFIFQNSHDMQTKIYLLKILKEFDNPKNRLAEDFYLSFLKAREILDKKTKPIPAPVIYQTDMRIFTTSHEPTEAAPSQVTEVHVFWNKTIGRLQANVVNSFDINGHQKTVRDNPQLRSYVKRYFDNLRQDGTYTDSEIDHFESKELNSPLVNTTYISFTKPNSDKMLAMIRIFDATNIKTFIENDFDLNFVERKSKERIFELGRLIATSEVEAKSFPYIMARVAEYFRNINASGVTYGDGNRSASAYYQRFGYKVAYTPEQLGLTGNATPMWVFKLSIKDLISKFLKPYESVKLRKSEN